MCYVSKNTPYIVKVIKSLNEWITENDENQFQKIAFLLDKRAIHSEPKQYKDLHKIFHIINKSDQYKKFADKNIPLFLWGWRGQDDVSSHYTWSKELLKLLNKDVEKPTSMVYNPSKIMSDSKYDVKKSGKLEIAKQQMKDGVEWSPKTVFNKKDAISLGFPLIAKSSISYQSRGVIKIDCLEQLEELNEKDFDLFQEAIKIDKEYRVILFRGKNSSDTYICGVFRREPMNDKSKSLRVDEQLSGEKLRKNANSHFKWIQVSNSDVRIHDIEANVLKDIANWSFEDNNNVLGIDICVDNNRRTWFIEINGAPGFISNWILAVYKLMYEDWYQKKLSKENEDMLIKMGKNFFDYSKKDYGDFDIDDASILDNYNCQKL